VIASPGRTFSCRRIVRKQLSKVAVFTVHQRLSSKKKKKLTRAKGNNFLHQLEFAWWGHLDGPCVVLLKMLGTYLSAPTFPSRLPELGWGMVEWLGEWLSARPLTLQLGSTVQVPGPNLQDH